MNVPLDDVNVGVFVRAVQDMYDVIIEIVVGDSGLMIDVQ